MSGDLDDLIDFAAVGETVLGDAMEASDALSALDAVNAVLLLDELEQRVKALRQMCAQQAVQTMEQPIQIDGRIVSVVEGGKWVRDEKALESQIITAAAGDAVKAVEIAFELCIPPSKLPTKTGLTKLGLSMRDVCSWESTGRKLDVRDVRAPEGER